MNEYIADKVQDASDEEIAAAGGIEKFVQNIIEKAEAAAEAAAD
jgi:hypothetical protein